MASQDEGFVSVWAGDGREAAAFKAESGQDAGGIEAAV